MRRGVFKVILYLLSGLLILTVVIIIVLLIKSPGKADPITGPAGEIPQRSISVIESVTIGGQPQSIIIRGADSAKPVILYLHGGPGSPEIAFMKATNREIENDFVVVYWEQRGSGKSYSKNIPPESMNMNQFISDTREVSEYLMHRFGKEKIYLMGHSWGSLLGIMTAYRHPEYYHAYMGIGQVAHQYKGERISFEWVKQEAAEKGDRRAIKALEGIQFPDSMAAQEAWDRYIMPERRYVMKFGGGVVHDMKGMWPVVKMILDAKEYTFTDKINFFAGSLFSTKYLWPEVISTNLTNSIDSMRLPVYIFQGRHDYQTPHSVARDFFDQLKAPHKEFFTFENSAHSPNMEEVERFNTLVREIARE